MQETDKKEDNNAADVGGLDQMDIGPESKAALTAYGKVAAYATAFMLLLRLAGLPTPTWPVVAAPLAAPLVGLLVLLVLYYVGRGLSIPLEWVARRLAR